MITKKVIFLIFCTVFVVAAAFSQQKLTIQPLLFSSKSATIKAFKPSALGAADISSSMVPVRPIPLSPSFSTAHWGFFCKQELKLEKMIKVPFRFRLGSVQQCDRLEGKRVAVTQ